MAKQSAVTAGHSSPLGATVLRKGVNFSLFSRHATAVELLLFDGVDDMEPRLVIPFDPVLQRTYHYGNAFVPQLKAGQLYAYRVTDPVAPDRGLRFDAAKVLLDPYVRGVVVPNGYSRARACQLGECASPSMKNVVVDPRQYASRAKNTSRQDTHISWGI